MAWDDEAIARPLAVVWDYMRLVHPAQPADAILTLGSFDPHAARHAAALWRAGLAPVVVMSGGIAHRGGLLDTGWDRAEAEVFADIAVAEGVPRQRILLEDRAQNTGDNFVLSRACIAAAGLHVRSLLVVAKPYMTRRGFATGRKVWPEVGLSMQCEPIAMADYLAREPDPERTLLAMMGDLHRILVYPRLGFQIDQAMPEEVMLAACALVDAGYGGRLIGGEPFAIPGSPRRRA